MPVYYQGTRAEHMAVRESAGLFDVSHMGQIETSGDQALALMQRLLSNDLAKPGIGGAQYSLLCRDDGGVLDDVITYRLDVDRFLTVTNAANHARDLAWFRDHADGLDVSVVDRLEDWAMLAVQGPGAREMVQALADRPLPTRLTCAPRFLGGSQVLVCATGYTGEDGVELLVEPDHAPELWDALVRRGAVPAGLGARDTLRMEVCFPLYGNELSTGRGPIEAGLGWACREDTNFIGSEAVREVRERGPHERLVAFVLDDAGIARQGNAIAGGGEVTSGTLSPCLGMGIGMAYVPTQRAEVGELLDIDVRGRTRAAHVRRGPLIEKRA